MTNQMDQLMRDKIADSLKDFHLWTDMIRSGEAEVTGLTIKRKPKALPDNADISYIMSCSNDEFEQVTGVRLSANAWDRWSDDMDGRTEQLLMLFEKAVAEEREKRQRYEDLVTGMTNLLELQQKRESTVIDMIAAGVVAEREACAKLADKYMERWTAEAIRARGNT